MNNRENVVQFNPLGRRRIRPVPEGRLLETEQLGNSLLISIAGGVRVHFTERLQGELEDAIAFAENCAGLSLVVIRTSGGSFCEGLDPQLVIAQSLGTSGRLHALLERQALLFRRISALAPATLCEIGGNAFGCGLELALACDLRITTHNARLGFPEISYGVAGTSFAAERTVRYCGQGNAARLLLTGEVVDGRSARAMGLVQWAEHVSDFEETARRIVSQMRRLSPEALRESKSAFSDCLNEERVSGRVKSQMSILATPDVRKRVADFL